MNMSNGSEPIHPGKRDMDFFGLTKREYFAGLAMQGLLANSAEDELQRGVGRIAHISVEHADAILAELDEEQK